MECPSCTFQNIPGTHACVRCATLLDLSGVDIMPPRASSGHIGRQVRFTALSVRHRLVTALGDIGRALRVDGAVASVRPMYLAAIVPGLPQILSRVMGLRILGWLILVSWCLALLIALLTVGSGFSLLLCFGSVSIHSFSVSLMLAPEMQRLILPMRMLLGLALYFLILLALYMPGYLLVQNLGQTVPVAGIRDNPVIANGDILLRTGVWTRPESFQRGDMVLVPVRGVGPVEGYYIPAGYNIDRVVAVSGDTIKIASGVLTVNGEEPPPDRAPLGSAASLPDGELVVGAGNLVVLPSVLGVNAQANIIRNRPHLLWDLSIHPANEVVGRIVFRLRPWARLGIPSGADE